MSIRGSSKGGHIIQDEGSDLPDKEKLDFVGAGVTVTDEAGKTKVEVTSGGGGEANTSSNVGTGEGLAKAKVAVDLPFKSLLGTASEINLVGGINEITFSLNSLIARINVTKTWLADQIFNDNVKLKFGTGSDFELYFDGTDFIIKRAIAGDLKVIAQQILLSKTGSTQRFVMDRPEILADDTNIGSFRASAFNANSISKNYGQIFFIMEEDPAGAEHGSVKFNVIEGGSSTNFLQYNVLKSGLLEILKKIKLSANLDFNAKNIENTNLQDFDEIATPANPSANHVRAYGKLDGGVTKLFYKQENGVEVGPLGVAGAGGGFSTVYKTSDESISSDIVLSNDADLFFFMDANSVYVMMMYVQVASGATPDYKHAFTLPALATGTGELTATEFLAGNFTASYEAESITVSQSGNCADAKTNFLLVLAIIIVGATAGNLQYQWAQATSSATLTTLKKGSWIQFKKVS